GDKEKLGKRQANAAVALLKLKQEEKVWPLLKHSPVPRARSYLVHRVGPLGVDPGAIIKRLKEEPDLTIRRALILSLGEFTETQLPPDVRQPLLPELKSIFHDHPDPGLHAASEWLLRKWQQEAWLAKTNNAWAKDREEQENRLKRIKKSLAKDKEK